METGLRRLVTAWSVFGVLVAADVTALAVIRRGGAVEAQLGRAALGAFIWGLMESFCGPWARKRQDRQEDPGTRKAARVMAEAVGEQMRAEHDKGGERIRRCS